MPNFEFSMALSAQKTREIHAGQAHFILVETDEGLKLQLPAASFRNFVTADGIHGRFRVKTDHSNKVQTLRRA